MKLTHRGAAVLAVAILAVSHGYLFGGRALNFVATPALAALAVGAVQLWRSSPPAVERSGLRPGYPGDRRTETISVEGSGVVTLRESLPEGLDGEPLERTVSLPHEVARKLTFCDRGIYRLGPTTVYQRDALGLFSNRVETDETVEAVVYPETFELEHADVLGSLQAEHHHPGGQSFDHLREYEPGDPLGRVHWKSSAKRDDLFVAEFEASRRTDPIDVVVEGQLSRADDLATAAATVVLHALDAGFEVSLTLPDDHLPDGRGQSYRKEVLRTLAATGGSGWEIRPRGRDSSSTGHEDADVFIRGHGSVVTVHVGDREWTLDQLRGTDAASRRGRGATGGSHPAPSGSVDA